MVGWKAVSKQATWGTPGRCCWRRADAGQVGRVVQRRQVGELLDRGDRPRRRSSTEPVKSSPPWTTRWPTAPISSRPSGWRCAGSVRAEDHRHRLVVVAGLHSAVATRGRCWCTRREPLADALSTMPRARHARSGHVEELVLDGGAAAVEDEDLHAHLLVFSSGRYPAEEPAHGATMSSTSRRARGRSSAWRSPARTDRAPAAFARYWVSL